MEKTSALRLLSGAHATAIVLDDEGYNHDEIASRLGIDPAAVGSLLHVARAKLAAVQQAAEGDATSKTGSDLHNTQPSDDSYRRGA